MINRQSVIDVLQERQNYYAERNESKQMFAIVNAIDDVLNLPSANPWHTGTPTEKGDYLCVFQSVWAVEYYWCYWDGAWDIYFDDYDPDTYTIVAWLPIPPFERKENPIEAFVRKQPCDKCLFQNTPNCKIFGIGVNGEMGCSFKERVRMSELKDDSAVILERTT